MQVRTRTLSTVLIAGLLATTLASGAFAVASFLQASEWNNTEKEYRRGYAAGALDMLRALADADYLSSSVRSKTNKIIDCVAGKSDGDIVRIFDGHVKRHPDNGRDSVAPALYIAMQESCGR
jgi:hypothetical protein